MPRKTRTTKTRRKPMKRRSGFKRKGFMHLAKITKPVRFKVPYPDRMYAELKSSFTYPVAANSGTGNNYYQVIGNSVQVFSNVNGGAYTAALPSGLYQLFGSASPALGSISTATGMYSFARVKRSRISIRWIPSGINNVLMSTGQVCLSIYPTNVLLSNVGQSDNGIREQKHVKFKFYPSVVTTLLPRISNGMYTGEIMGFSKECMIEDGQYDQTINSSGIITSPVREWLWNINLVSFLSAGTVGQLYGEIQFEVINDVEFFLPNLATGAIPT